MVMLAFDSSFVSFRFTASYRSISYWPRLSALMTRIPVAFSRTTRII